MGQKVNPIGMRLGIIKNWQSRWFADREYARFLKEDLTIRRYTAQRLQNAGLAKIDILRAPKRVTVDIHTSKPGIVIGRKGAEVDKLKEELQLLTSKEITITAIGRIGEIKGLPSFEVNDEVSEIDIVFLLDENAQFEKLKKALKGEEKKIKVSGKIHHESQEGHSGHPYTIVVQSFEIL